MQVHDVRELVKATKGVKEEDVQEAVNTVRQVESLGGTRTQYNIAPPFGSLARQTARLANSVKLKSRLR
jgi:hypothetical protein